MKHKTTRDAVIRGLRAALVAQREGRLLDIHYYEGLSAEAWPRMANLVIDLLEHDREISDPEVLRHFVPRPHEPSTLSRLVARIRSWFRAG